MPLYRIEAHRTTSYEVSGDDPNHASDEMIEGNGKETGQETTGIEAHRICPTCKEDLTNETIRDVELGEDCSMEEPTWCPTCKIEVTA